MDSCNTCAMTRTIFCLRCAAYLRLLPRTRPQQKQLLAQTHSRRRAMLASTTKIDLPSFAHVFAGITLISVCLLEPSSRSIARKRALLRMARVNSDLLDAATYIAMLPVQVLLIVSPVWVFCANDAVNCNRMSEWRTI